jgi:hypothetical protein
LAIEELAGSRFDLAMARLREGHILEFRDVGFRIDDDGTLLCIVDSSWAIRSVTAARATADLDGGKVVLEALINSSPDFAQAVRGRPVRYELIHDYGTGAVLLCSRIGDRLEWARGFRAAQEVATRGGKVRRSGRAWRKESRSLRETLYRGSKFTRWTLSPVVALALISLPLLTSGWSPGKVVVVTAIELMLACLLVSLLAPGRFPAVVGVVTATIFAGYVAYAVDALVRRPSTLTPSAAGDGTSPLNAVSGLVLIGIPSLLLSVAFFRQWSRQRAEKRTTRDERSPTSVSG